MKKIVVVANVVLLTIAAGLAVDLFYSMIDYHYQAISATQPMTPEEPVDSTESEAELHASLAYYQPIIGRDLFKIGAKENALPEPDPAKDLENTDLNIKLWGTVTGKEDFKYAVIEAMGESRRREQQLYREGDTVETAKIEQILEDKIILSNNGRRQVLQMETFLQGAGRSFSRRTARISRPRTYRRTISRSMLNNAAQNFNQLISQARIVPDANGMKISAIKPSSIFRRLGLRNGDIVTSVNNRHVRSVEDAMNIYRDLQNGGSVSVQLLRRNRPRTIEFQVR